MGDRPVWSPKQAGAPYYSQNTGVDGIIGKLGRLEAMILS